ncbi:MAG: hypothetical protein LLG00_00620 [Planctomycetaceae bacterium]|nr:hypothetical protein [Planctomycetaceae bacterium]
MTGEVTYLYAYDIATEANLTAIETQFRGAAEWFHIGRSKDAPRNFPSYRPLTLQLDDLQINGPLGPMTLHTSIKLFSVGAVSVNVRIPITCERVTDLVALRTLTVKADTSLDDRISEIVHRLLATIGPKLDSPVQTIGEPEVYTIFRLDMPPADPAAADLASDRPLEHWLSAHERDVAALLVGETDATRLSAQEVQETLQNRYSYYCNELTVLDWDAAFVIDTAEGCRDTFYVIEVANLQLEELRVYDAELDKVLDKAYDDVEATARPHAFHQRRRVLADLREIRMDLTRVTEELSNITKFVGDWHIARVYMGCVARFHLSQWEDMVSQKLRSLDSLYTMLQQDSTNRAMLILEASIVALFVIDVIVIVALGVK